MKDFAGTPGTLTGFALRVSQFLFASASIASMTTTSSFFNFTAFCYLVASMGLQVIWSLGLAMMDAYALAKKRTLHNPILVSLFVIGDWQLQPRQESPFCIFMISEGVTIMQNASNTNLLLHLPS
ncbi:CASP-like protein 5B3 isoform X2 [Amaranthus tricolor]|uniref:CASP-like protein 5B3 isoform X2 n=1 Tax=Amaranthus tricolor TaxID=29722 RepID=UPI002590245C|nr:CASP-like protein 5B3 isoform X2 [Amaranthus tricolor]